MRAPWPRRPGIWVFCVACAGRATTFPWNLPRAIGGLSFPGSRGARLRVGFSPKKPRMRGRAFHVLAPRWDDRQHMVEAFLGQAKALGLEPRDTSLKYEPGEEGRAEAQRLLSQAGLEPRGYVLVHPTSRWMFKSWTHGGNAALINHLASQGLQGGAHLRAGPQGAGHGGADQRPRPIPARWPWT